MADWTTKLGSNAATEGPEELVQAFSGADDIVDRNEATWEGDCWRIDASKTSWFRAALHLGRTVELFQASLAGRSGVLLVYRAKLRPENLSGRAYLEMWCRVNGREFFSRGHAFGELVEGSGDWRTVETPFLSQPGEQLERARLNVVIEGSGIVQVKDVELIALPLAGR